MVQCTLARDIPVIFHKVFSYIVYTRTTKPFCSFYLKRTAIFPFAALQHETAQPRSSRGIAILSASPMVAAP